MSTQRHTLLTLLALAFLLAVPQAANGDGGIKVGWYSQQLRPTRAAISAHIQASAARSGISNEGRGAPAAQAHARHAVATVGADRTVANLPPPFPVLPSSSPILRDQHPFGPDSFWYTDGAGHVCQYVPDSVTPCFTVVGPGAKASGSGLAPSAVAASLTRRLELTAGAIQTSPARTGLTGADSWFWLDPAPQRQTLSISLAGETVSVVADPTVGWRFGDGGSFDGGPGVPYHSGVAPAEAIRHVYQTRCLPGDRGHDPYVLGSCGQTGYSVDALVVWRITYSAAGPLGESGTLPTRTTESSAKYPVSESRAFLVRGGGA
jgi:hypothetical protein